MTIIVSETGIVVPPTPTPDPARSRDVTLFPNPASEDVNLTFTGMQGDAKVSIVNLTGSVVFDQKINITNQNVKINLPNLQPGFYLVYIKSDDAIMARKLIIEQKTR